MRVVKLETKIGKTNVTATYSYSGLTEKVKQTINSGFAEAVIRHIKGDKDET